ncbi:MAG: Nmad3 family putative nucleotide modification protein [Phycisphaerales bacterium]
MKAILVRIGVDHSSGGWNAPADPDTGQYVYVPIPEKHGTEFHPGCNRRYQEIVPALEQFSQTVDADLFDDLRCLRTLLDESMHLDPDFDHLTYGDVGARRGSHIRDLAEDDLLVFYAGLRPCRVPRAGEPKLVYALVGLYVIQDVVSAPSIPQPLWNHNAHTRKIKRGNSDIVVRAKPGVSGRFTRFIPIGEYRDRAYRVRPNIVSAWGGLTVNDGYLQRSARPPRFLDPERFMQWLDQQHVEMVAANNPPAPVERVFIVHLRRPDRSNPEEMRSDPFWEFGSFGCTGCHRKNLMHPDHIHELSGARLAFAQGGALGFRLVMLTPPVRVVRHADRCELQWEPTEMPFRYAAAPLLIDRDGNSDMPALKRLIGTVDRTTGPGQFSSKFRSSRTPLRPEVAAELIDAYQRLRNAAIPSLTANRYEQALPYPPNLIDQNRKRTYQQMVLRLKDKGHSQGSRKC